MASQHGTFYQFTTRVHQEGRVTARTDSGDTDRHASIKLTSRAFSAECQTPASASNVSYQFSIDAHCWICAYHGSQIGLFKDATVRVSQRLT